MSWKKNPARVIYFNESIKTPVNPLKHHFLGKENDWIYHVPELAGS